MRSWIMMAFASALLVIAFAPTAPLLPPKNNAKEMSEDKVLARGAEIARLVAADAGELQIKALRIPPMDSDKLGASTWEVSCVDRTGTLRLRLQIDGGTEDVFGLTSNRPIVKTNPSERITPADGSVMAHRWFDTIKPLGPSTRLTATAVWPVRRGWLVRLDGAGKRSFAIIDGRTGTLHSMSSSSRIIRHAAAASIDRA